MKLLKCIAVFAFVFFSFSCKDKKDDNSSTSTTTTPSSSSANTLAFPHAEGGGKYSVGGRGGEVYYVTNLSDDGNVGSFRYAVGQTGARTVIFKVSGTIQLTRRLEITHPNITIAGQTAPGNGITIRDYPVYIAADNVIVRFIRFRMGDVTDMQDDALGAQGTKNVIVDHCTMSWSTDECGSFYNNTDFTLQWSILSESLNNSVHDKGIHGYGGIWGGNDASFHHNLLAHHNSRNPRFDHDCISILRGPIDFENNVIYNWGENGSYGGENRRINIVNNYYKSGPATSAKYRIFNAVAYDSIGFCDVEYNTAGSYYINGNYMNGYPAVTADNWSNNGVQLRSGGTTAFATFVSKCKVSSPFAMATVNSQSTTINSQTAEAAYQSVLSYAGANYVRDAIDKRIINEVTNGTYTYTGSKGSTGGLIDSQADVKDNPSGGWLETAGVIQANSSVVDSDGDGMPDAWEDAHGLNKNIKDDGATTTLSGGTYTNLEVYLNSLVESLYPY
ncbi:MAG: pectate lyase [Paludibacteraceae bacterium]|nr:pectate lyase [Paludibacteraceae bacterium]